MPLPLDLADRRYVQQAGWTAPMRRHLFRRAGLSNAQRVLEIGCGTGAVLRSIVHAPRTGLFGLDLDYPALRVAHQHAPSARLAAGDAHRLPYADQAFDISFFHFVLLWLKDPVAALVEARRVTRVGGAVLALAEPDYSRRIDKPASLAPLGIRQTEALRAQGASPELGAKLPELFRAAGLSVMESGQIAQQDGTATTSRAASLEWEVLRTDLQGRLPEAELDRLAAEDLRTRQAGERVVFVPTFYARAIVGTP